MKWTIAILMAVGCVAALCAALLVASLRADIAGDNAAGEEVTGEMEILVATRSLPAMTVLDAGAIAKKTIDRADAPEDVEENLLNVVGQVLVTPVVEGAVFRKSYFATEESGLHLATALPEGRRAMSTVLTTETGIEDLLYPGAVVDVIASFRLPAAQGRPAGEVVSSTLLQGVQVLAVGPRSIVHSEAENESMFSNVDSKQKRRVTLMVDNDQAEALQLATAYGDVSLALRNPLDTGARTNRGVLLSELSGGLSDRLAALGVMTDAPPMFIDADDSEAADVKTVEPQAAPVRRQRMWTTEVLRGGKNQTVTFPMKDAEEEK